MQSSPPIISSPTLQDPDSIIVSVTIADSSTILALVDSGSTLSYINDSLVRQLRLSPEALEHPIAIVNFDGSTSPDGVVTSRVKVPLRLGPHLFEDTPFLVTALPSSTPIIIGFDFAERHGLNVSWATKLISVAPIRTSNQIIDPPTGSMSEWTNEQDYEPPSSDKARELVPLEYHDFLDVFSKEKGESLPDHQPHDLTIELVPGATPPYQGIYRLAGPEQETLKTYIDEMLEKGLIRESSSRAASPVLFVPKKGGELRLCVDYRKLNNMTVKDRYPLPSTDMLLDQLSGARIYTKIDLRWAYHRIRIAKGHEWKTAFRTRYGLFEYLVMPFGLTNCPATFQRHVNSVLRHFIDKFVVVYLDDILIYSANVEEHRKHVRLVLQTLREHQLYAKAEKCDFHTTKVDYLGFIISPDGVSMDLSKVEDIVNWTQPTNQREVRGFLGFANFYRRFILNYSRLAKPLYDLTKKEAAFTWTNDCQAAFEALKARFTSKPILRHFEAHLPTRLESDASDYAIGAVLSQQHEDDLWHPLAYISRTLNPAERNYDIHDKEMLAVVFACIEWRPLLLSLSDPFVVLTDHHALEYFMTTKILNRRQARWAERLADFHFTLSYRPGTANTSADALSRRDDARTLSGGASSAQDDSKDELRQPFFKEHHLRRTTTEPHQPDLLLERIKLRQGEDQALQEGLSTDPPQYTKKDGLIQFKDRIAVPSDDEVKLRILQSKHDHTTAGHPGTHKTFDLVKRDYAWKGMKKYVTDYVHGCLTCARSKSLRHKKYGLLQPLPIPERPWASISMDFIEQLPESDGYDSILVVVDRLTKMALFIPTDTTTTAQDLADLFVRHVFSKHGVPNDIVSDRGSKFTSIFWTALSNALKIQQKLSTAYHPETDGQTERVNQILETYLRHYVNYDQNDWARYLPLAEFAYNNSTHSATTMSPFFANKGYHPTLDIAMSNSTNKEASVEITKINELHQHVKGEIAKANERYKEDADRHRTEPPQYKVGDEVMLMTKNIRTTRPTKKFAERKLGPFTISQVVSPLAMKLDLPQHLAKIHPVFHVSLLEPVKPDTIRGRRQPPPPPVEVLEELQWEVKSILDSRRRNGRVQYLVEWLGFEDDEYERQTWEPWQNLEGAKSLVRQYHQDHPDKPQALELGSSDAPTQLREKRRKVRQQRRTR